MICRILRKLRFSENFDSPDSLKSRKYRLIAIIDSSKSFRTRKFWFPTTFVPLQNFDLPKVLIRRKLDLSNFRIVRKWIKPVLNGRIRFRWEDVNQRMRKLVKTNCSRRLQFFPVDGWQDSHVEILTTSGRNDTGGSINTLKKVTNHERDWSDSFNFILSMDVFLTKISHFFFQIFLFFEDCESLYMIHSLWVIDYGVIWMDKIEKFWSIFLHRNWWLGHCEIGYLGFEMQPRNGSKFYYRKWIKINFSSREMIFDSFPILRNEFHRKWIKIVFRAPLENKPKLDDDSLVDQKFRITW